MLTGHTTLLQQRCLGGPQRTQKNSKSIDTRHAISNSTLLVPFGAYVTLKVGFNKGD